MLRTAFGQESDAADLLTVYGISDEDLARVRAYGERVAIAQIDSYIEAFYDWMRAGPEYDTFFADDGVLQRAQKMQRENWRELFRAEVDDAYVAHRRNIGETHARIGLPLTAYFAGMNFSLDYFTSTHDGEPPLPAADVGSLTRMVHLDTAVVVEEFNRLVQKRLTEQSRALMEMSTPVTAIWGEILLLPIVGVIDSKRAHDVMEAMLLKIAETRSRVIILDISGVAVVDTAVANHLLKITRATRLMGCECLISGISPAVAQTMVDLGIDVGDVRTMATLRDAVAAAFREAGLRVSSRGDT